MAQLKDSLITGDLRVTGTIYGLGTGLTNIDASQITSGGLEIRGHIAGDSGTTGHGLYGGGGYHNAYNNIILHGDGTTGSSGIAFISDKGSTAINQPSDRAFIQFHAYGITTASAEGTNPTLATTGENNRLVIGVGNDATDQVWLQTPGVNGLIHQVGATSYVIPSLSGTTTTANYPLISTTTAGLYANNTNITMNGGAISAGSLTLSTKLTMTSGKPINQILTGTGTAAADAGSGNSPRYTPAKWTYNTGANAANGDIFTIKIPVAGHNWGVYISVNNGTNYYPLVHQGTSRVTTHYPSGYIIQVIFDSSGSAASMTPVAGADSVNGSTITGGVFRILNYYADGNNYNWVRPYYVYWKTRALLGRYQLVFTQDEQYLLSPCAVDNNTGTSKTITTLEFDPFGDVYYYQAGSSVTAGNKIGDNNLMSTNGLIDLRYSFNITTSTFTAQKGVYAVLVPQANGKVKFHTTPLTQTLPTTADGLIYKYLGQAYDGYRIQLIQEKPCYCFKNGALRLYTGPGVTLNFASNGTITGDGSTLSFPITHSLATMDVMVQVYNLSTYETVEVDVVRTSNSIVTVTFATAPASGTNYKVLILNMNTNTISDIDSTFGNTSTITGNGSTTSFAISHSFSSRDVMVQIYDTASYDTVQCDVIRTDTSTVTVTFPTAPVSGKAYRVMLLNMG